MTIGTALVVIAVLYFIDKYHLWKKAALVCVIVLGVTLAGAAGYYGWHTWQEKKSQAALERKSVSEVTQNDPYASIAQPISNSWDGPSPPKGFVFDDVSYAILYSVKADPKAKTEAWTWYRDSTCVTSGRSPEIYILNGITAFDLDRYSHEWLENTALPDNVKRALWSAKATECKRPPGSQVSACLNRETLAVNEGRYGIIRDCGPRSEMVHLNGQEHHRVDTQLRIPNPFVD